MLAWDLDKDTHEYFRKHLDIFISHRKISKEVRQFTKEAGTRLELFDLNRINPIRYGLNRRVAGGRNVIDRRRVVHPLAISHIHPTRYYIAGILGNHTQIRIDTATLTDSILFHIPSAEDITQICKEYNCKIPKIAFEYTNDEFHIRSVLNKRYVIRYLMKAEDSI